MNKTKAALNGKKSSQLKLYCRPIASNNLRSTQSTDPVRKSSQLYLERGRIIRCLQRHHDLAIGRIRANAGDEERADTLVDLASGEDKGVEFLRGSAVYDILPRLVSSGLLHLVGFSSSRRLVTFDSVSRQ